MYYCDICNAVSKPKQSVLRHFIKREDGSIEREMKLCPTCHAGMEAGLPEKVVRRGYRHTLPGLETAGVN